ncbi:MAG TPA: hypothetical protein VGN72_00315 [Tepidisphaeraceae bacterium]|jgi:hypothetical protein|nr:hypothetical protein [Tepidisphaeraceae bacterium]
MRKAYGVYGAIVERPINNLWPGGYGKGIGGWTWEELELSVDHVTGAVAGVYAIYCTNSHYEGLWSYCEGRESGGYVQGYKQLKGDQFGLPVDRTAARRKLLRLWRKQYEVPTNV